MDESLFKRLLFAGEDEENFEELVELGYFGRKEGIVFRTKKFIDETDSFIKSKKDSLYKAVKQLGSAADIGKTMEMAGIKDFITFVFIAEELIADGRFVKDREKNCLIKS
ncbi:MAG TPA: hypothetical protein PK728_00715 [Bacillota bacterium]|nr:hypothetical protein [Bacillota bacterium]